MRVFFRSAPVLMALSVALAGCSQSDPPGSKPPSDSGSASGVSATTPDSTSSSEYVLTVEGMK